MGNYKCFHDADEIHIFARALVNIILSSVHNCPHVGTVLKFVSIIFLKHLVSILQVLTKYMNDLQSLSISSDNIIFII